MRNSWRRAAACVYCPVSPSRQKTKVAVICVFPHTRSIWTISSIGADEEKKERISRNQDTSCLVRKAEQCSHNEPLIKHQSSRAGRNSEMLSITGEKKNHQLLTDLGLVVPWTLSLFFFFPSCSAVSVALAGFSQHCGFGGTMVSLFLGTFVGHSVSTRFSVVGM